MNLIIDVGNSLVKIAVFEKNHLLLKEVVAMETLLTKLSEIKSTYKVIQKVILSSVGKLDVHTVTSIKTHFDLFILNSEAKLPFNNKYETPKTLGVDRMALVCAAITKFPNRNVLIIDAGTCITYDFVTSTNNYLGGAISPGLRMRYQSLHNLTANLPLLDVSMPEDIIGNSTVTSIHSGVVMGVLKEIEGVINEYIRKYSDLTIILTGGDGNFLSKQLKSSIFATSNFLLEGLNVILQFNSNE